MAITSQVDVGVKPSRPRNSAEAESRAASWTALPLPALNERISAAVASRPSTPT